MNNTDTKSDPLRDSVFGSGLSKKHRRRRYRNKNSSWKKKKSKKFYPSKKSTYFKFKPNIKRVMSNWYWENYKKALEWQDRHKVAYWKSCALALLEENRYLVQIINSMQPGRVPGMTVTQNFGKEANFSGTYKSKRSKNSGFPQHHMDDADEDDSHNVNDVADDDDDGDENDNEDKEETSDDFELEMSEEMMRFFEESYKHKMDLKKLKEKEMLKNTEKEIKKIQTNKLKRSTEMNLLYGDGASMITGMETAVQLSFDKYCDTKSPRYWPNIPFKL